MPPTKITPSVRYFRPGTTKVYWLTSIETLESPSRSELNNGIDLSGEIAEINGFQVTSAFLDAPDLGTRFVQKVPARTNAEDSSINFYASSTGSDVRSILPRDTSGYIVIMDAGDVATTGKMDVYPVTVAAAPKLRGLEDVAQISVQFAITGEPLENLPIPG